MVYKYLDGNRHIYVVDDAQLVEKADELFGLKEKASEALDVIPTNNPLPQPKVLHKDFVSQKAFEFEGFKGMTPTDMYNKFGIKGIMLMYKTVGKVEDKEFAEYIVSFCKKTLFGDASNRLKNLENSSEKEIRNFIYLYMPVIEQAYTKILQSKGYSDWNGFSQENNITVQQQVYEALLHHVIRRTTK